MDAERRKYPRVPINLLIQYRFDSFEEFEVDYAANLSEGGMYLRAEQPKPDGALIYLQFAFKDGRKLIEGLGRVIHVQPKGTANPGMGIELVSFDEEFKQMIRALIAQSRRA